MADSGLCIICSCETTDKSHGGGFQGARRYWHWRCSDLIECAVRRNARKRRPRPEADVRAEFEERALAQSGGEGE